MRDQQIEAPRVTRTQSGRATNAPATATVAAPGLGRRNIILGWVITSSGGAVAAAVQATISGLDTGNGGAASYTIDIPAIALPPGGIWSLLPCPKVCAENTAASVTVPALGAGIVGNVTIFCDVVSV